MSDQAWVITMPVKLPTVGTAGAVNMDIPKLAKFMAVLNGSAAVLAVSKGVNFYQPQDAVLVQPYIYVGFPIDPTQKQTIHWTSTGVLSSTTCSAVVVYSNEPINISGGPMTTGGVASNVQVVGVPTVNVNTMPNVTIGEALPVGANSIGTVGLNAGVASIGTVGLNAGVASIGTVGLNAGANVIGKIQVAVGGAVDGWDTSQGAQADAAITTPASTGSLIAFTKGILKQLQGGGTGGTPITNANIDATLSSLVTAVNAVTAAVTATPKAAAIGIVSSSQIAVGPGATVLFSGVVTGDSITVQNFDGAGYLYLGPATVTTANGGVRIPPGGTWTLDVISGSTITIYGAGSVALTAGISVNN